MTYWFTYLKAWTIIKRKWLYHILFGANSLDYTRFAILCTSRSGSTWLHTLLNAHPHIVSKGEVVFQHHKLSKAFHLEKDVFHAYPSVVKAVGLKVFYGLDNDIYDPTFQGIIDDPKIKVIHLVREDKLSQFVSLQLAKKNHEWSHQKNSRRNTVRLELPDFLEFNVAQLNLQSKIDQDFDGRILSVSYEDLVSNQSETLDRVQEFLKVKQRRLFSALKKQSTVHLKNQIENWSDFESSYSEKQIRIART